MPTFDRESVTRRLAEIFSDVFELPLEAVHEGLQPDDIDLWDSMGHLSLIGSVEEAFACTFTIDEILELTSFRTLADVVMAKKSPSVDRV